MDYKRGYKRKKKQQRRTSVEVWRIKSRITINHGIVISSITNKVMCMYSGALVYWNYIVGPAGESRTFENSHEKYTRRTRRTHACVRLLSFF